MRIAKEIAPAKINLSLNVIGEYADGYHRLETIMQSIDLCDVVKIAAAGKGINLKVSGTKEVPEDRSNLVWQAAKLMKEKFALDFTGLRIELEKNIPVSAGLGGGSSDAAAVIRAINWLFSLGLKKNTMEKLALQLGADVPFCINGGTALARGKGEKLTFLPALRDHPLLLIKPELSVSTKEVFARVDEEIISRQVPTLNLVNVILSGQEIGWQEGWENNLEQVTLSLYPHLKELKEKLSHYNPLHLQMSGSGPTFMAFFKEKSRIDKIISEWQGEEELYAVEFLPSASDRQ